MAEPQTAKKDDTLATQYNNMHWNRNQKLERSREHAELVIPGLLPRQGYAQRQELPVPYNSMPAEGVMNLGARMVSVLYPLNNIPFFELQINDPLVPEGEDITEENKLLGRFGQAVMNQLLPTNFRSALFMAEQQLIVVGDVLLFMRPDYNVQIFRLDQFVVKRAADGEWKELIIEEWVDPTLLPKELQGFEAVKAEKSTYQYIGPADKNFEAVYTKVKYNEETEKYDVQKEFRNRLFDDNTTYEVSPYFPMRWSSVAGEDYGRSMVEDAFGDIRVLDALSKALMDGNLMNSEFRWGVNPAGITEIDDFDSSTNGQSIPAVQGDIFPIQAQNIAQVQVTLAAVQDREKRLGRRFLMNSMVQPTGDRVTARQVTILAQELEQALGGVLSLQTREHLVPMIRRVMYQMAVDELFPPDIAEFLADPHSILKIHVKAGLEVLRREIESEKLTMVAQGVSQLPPEAQQYMIWPNWLDKWISSHGIETVGLIKTEEQIMAEQQAAMAQQAALQASQTAQQAAVEASKQPPAQET